MSISNTNFSIGNLVCARGREWVVQPESKADWLRLRPLGGSDDEIIALMPELEFQPVEQATFPTPDPEKLGNHAAALLLRDALRLKLRAGGGPFRSFGNIAVEPRAYQLVPLLMALRLTTVRLLIADDVGIGKTIEAGLIARELMDRGEINRFAVLCPPHLVDQWQNELDERFNLQAVALTSASASRIERNLPHGVSLFDHHKCVVVSLDYIKSERHREHFLTIAPECIIVDEAHTCASSGQGKQLRFELLKRLVANEERHLLLLTATPHSGDEEAFYNLLSLLNPKFTELQHKISADDPLRVELARHFVQRRRKDIDEWHDSRGFPKRMTTEITYQLSGAWGQFFDDVQSYCRELAESVEVNNGGNARLIWYATLALLRCVASSPAAAVKALNTRLIGSLDNETCLMDNRLHDGSNDDLAGNDLEPPAQLQDIERLQNLITQANNLSGESSDPKLAILIEHVKHLLKEGYHPVIFCRYIATSHYVAQQLQKQFPNITIESVTGEYTPEERKLRVQNMEDSEQRVLVATDCLSEGINLQHLFTAVIHYDLAWNPTRHEQREGRVDRFGQQASEVRCSMLYGQDNPVDGFVLNVILRKAETIRQELGVLVPMPEDETRINQALVKAALMKRVESSKVKQLSLFDFKEAEAELKPLQAQWQNALEKAKANRTIFAQRRIRPDEVMPEWEKQQNALGTEDDVKRFVKTACARLNAPLELGKRNNYKLLPQHFPEAFKKRLFDEGIEKPLLLNFKYLHRSHPVVTLLAEYLLEDALTSENPLAARCAVTVTEAVDVVTTLYVLRLRHQLSYVRRRQPYQLMAEETVTLAVRGRSKPEWLIDEETDNLLKCEPSGNLPVDVMRREIKQALDFIQSQSNYIESLAKSRSEILLSDHQRVREAARDVGQYNVSPCLPVDVIGVYVLLPDAL
jgi:superfamily II DNA or RNA helicase